MEEKKLSAEAVFFRSEMTVNKAYLRRTWAPLPRLRRARWLIALLPLACLLYSGYVMLTQGDLPLGIPIMAGIFLLFALMLPALAISQMFNQYRQFRADGLRRVSLLADGVETEMVKYGSRVFHGYDRFDRVEEDREHWLLVMPGGQKVLVPKAPCLAGDPSRVKAWLTERIAACAETAEHGGTQ